MRVIPISSIVNMHKVSTRACDNQTFVLCSMEDQSNVWVSRESIVKNDEALASRLRDMETRDVWPLMNGGRRRELTSKNCAWAKTGDVITGNHRRPNVPHDGSPTKPTNADLVRRVLVLERLVDELEQKLLRLTTATSMLSPTHVGDARFAPNPGDTGDPGSATQPVPFVLSTQPVPFVLSTQPVLFDLSTRPESFDLSTRPESFDLSTLLTQPPSIHYLECAEMNQGLPVDGWEMTRTSSCLSALLG